MLIDINTCFGASPQRRVRKALHVQSARMCRPRPGLEPTTQDVDWSLDNLIRIMDEHGVNRACAYSLRGKLYDFVSGNDETLRASQLDPRIEPVATIDPRRHFGCLEEIERCVDNGFRLFRFFPDEQGWSVRSLPFMTICEELAQYPVAIMVPAGGWGDQTFLAERLCDFGFPIVAMEASFGQGAETAALTERYETFYADTSALNTADTIEAFVRHAGAARLLFGSDSPEMYFESAYRLVEVARIEPEQRDMILGGNALKQLLKAVGA
ncbi:MAG TPA: hypothetical protein DGT21_18495 [Armatimonadetes bacterium]|jgi:predicted TIM-barrel fold metal-dependent hydrolase|nr:hypothetical protein [Armatimonadota bacterium]